MLPSFSEATDEAAANLTILASLFVGTVWLALSVIEQWWRWSWTNDPICRRRGECGWAMATPAVLCRAWWRVLASAFIRV